MSKDNGKILTVNYQEVPLVKVLDHFAKGFTFEDKSKVIAKTEAFIDTVRGYVVYKLYVEEKAGGERNIVLPNPLDALATS